MNGLVSNLRDTVRRRRRLFILILVILLVAVMALTLNDYIQERIAPGLLSWMWGVWIMSSGFPQVMTWAFFVAAIPVIAIFSLVRARPSVEDSPYLEEAKPVGQVQTLTRWIRQAPEGDYFRLRLVRHLSKLALDILEYKERAAPGRIREAVENGRFDIDADIRDYLKTGWRKRALATKVTSSGRKQLSQLARRASRRDEPWRDPMTEKVIRFLETELEVEGES